MNELRLIQLAKLKPSATPAQRERRAHFDTAAIADLAESIKTVGLLSPIVARPWHSAAGLNHLASDPDFEIVAGERRYVAAKQAGLTEIPVSVRELSDTQVLEVQLIENLQREDLHELAEAEGYETLQKHGYTVDDMAAKVGKSKATVYARMKLLALTPKARKAFYEGKLTASTALLLARIPVPALQEQALKEITEPRWGDSVMSFRDAQRHVHDTYMLRLDQAGFPTSDAELVPGAGACRDCPKRTGNQRELFGDVKSADVCTDPGCFRAKVDAHAERRLAEASAAGRTVITGAAAKKLAPNGAEHSAPNGYVRLADHCWDDAKNRTYAQLLGKSAEPTLLQDPKSGKVVELMSEKEVAAALKAKGVKLRENGDSDHGRDAKSEQRALQKKRDLDLGYRAALFIAVREASMKRSKVLLRSELEQTAERLFKDLSHDEEKRLAKVLSWPVEKAKNYGRVVIKLPQKVADLTDADLAQLIRDLVLAHELVTWTYSSSKPESLEAAAAELSVDAKKIRADLVAAAKAKVKAKSAKPKPKASKLRKAA